MHVAPGGHWWRSGSKPGGSDIEFDWSTARVDADENLKDWIFARISGLVSFSILFAVNSLDSQVSSVPHLKA